MNGARNDMLKNDKPGAQVGTSWAQIEEEEKEANVKEAILPSSEFRSRGVLCQFAEANECEGI